MHDREVFWIIGSSIAIVVMFSLVVAGVASPIQASIPIGLNIASIVANACLCR